jgi:hypothetical protein
MPKRNKAEIEQLQRIVDSDDRLLGFHLWLLDRFEAYPEGDLKQSLINEQKKVIKAFQRSKDLAFLRLTNAMKR